MKLAIQYVSDDKGNTNAVQLSLPEWKRLISRMKKYEQMLKLKQELSEGFADVKKMRKGVVKKQELSAFLDEL